MGSILITNFPEKITMLDEITITCPYCGEAIDVLVDYSSGSLDYYEDCSVCCQPILFSVSAAEPDKSPEITVKRDDE